MQVAPLRHGDDELLLHTDVLSAQNAPAKPSTQSQ
jgi:hypothetical protein